jgi:hypothetical protein
LVGWLSGFGAQTGSVAKAIFVRRLGEAAAPGEGSASFVVGPARPLTQHGYYHDTKVKPEAITANIEFMMMGGKKPETC